MGILLAGGVSSRFSSDKALAPLDGKTFLRCVYETLARVLPEDRIFISAPPSRYPSFERVLPDKTPGLGPLSGIWTAFSALSAEGYLFVPVDMPLLTPSALLRLVGESLGGPSYYKNSWLPLFLPRTKTIEKAIHRAVEEKEYSLGDLIGHLPHPQVLAPKSSQILRNINTNEELRALF